MKIFVKDMTIVDGLFDIVFLCGSHFNILEPNDKRTILKTFINERYGTNVKVIILEENFLLEKSKKEKLGYDSIFLKSLAKIEKMIALYSDKVIVIHESISTAAELGMFSIDPTVARKTCMIVPDINSQEEDKVSFFLKNAFRNLPDNVHSIKEIRFYPDTKRHNKSPNRTEYYTYFHNNEIGKTLESQITSFLELDAGTMPTHFTICEGNYWPHSNFRNRITYTLSHDENADKDNAGKKINISIDAKALQILLMSIIALYCNDIDFKREKLIYQHVEYLWDKLDMHMKESVKHYSGQEVETDRIAWTVRETECSIRDAIGLYLYILQAISFISMDVPTYSSDYDIRRIVIKEGFTALKNSLCNNLERIETTEFGGMFYESEL